MSLSIPYWENSIEPNEGNIRMFMEGLYSKSLPVEQARWNRSNTDTAYYAGNQRLINSQFGINYNTNGEMYFNLLAQPVNMVTGYERQHRKSITFVPGEGGDGQTTDQYTKVIHQACITGGIYEQISKAYELSAVSGMVLVQPYLDYTCKDPAQGDLRLKIWEYNSFIIDPYFRDPCGSDANYCWTQEYIAKGEAKARFGDKVNNVNPVSWGAPRNGTFYFLPENYNTARNDLMILSYVWYKWNRKRKKLYSHSRYQFFDFSGGDEQIFQLMQVIPDLEEVEIDVPTWKVAVVLNDQLMYQGENPMGFDAFPMVPIFWNYEPHNNNPDLRVRSLVSTMRSSNYLMNRQIIISHDQKEATINAGWMRKQGAIANEDNVKKTGQGWDIIINDGFEMTDVQKIQTNVVPESDFALADRARNLIFGTSGIDIENWAAQKDKQSSSLTMMLKTAANLTVLQKYFDQWDYAKKLVGERCLDIVLHQWNAYKIEMLIGEDPSPYFFSRIFSTYQTVVEEGLMTPTQKNMQAQAKMDINAAFGREVYPPSMVVKDMNIQGRDEDIKFLEQQEQQAAAVQSETTNIQHAFESAKLQELYSKSVSNMANAVERHGRAESNIGLFEERLSMIQKNRSISTREKMDALVKLVEATKSLGEIEAMMEMGKIEAMNASQAIDEDREKIDAKRTAMSNQFTQEIMGNMMNQVSQQQIQGGQGQMGQEQAMMQ